jgi:hypothetical protein
MSYNVLDYAVLGYNVLGYNLINYNNYRDIISTGVCVYSGISYYFIENKMLVCNMLMGIYTLDLFFNKETYTNNQYILHHILILFLFGTFHYYKYYDFFDILVNPALSFQISTIFLDISILLEHYNIHKNIQNINLLFFISSFFYYRLYRYYYDVVINPEIFIYLEKYTYTLILVPFFFFTLNIFWACIIIKKIAKPLKIIQSEYVSEYFCRYILLINIPITFYKYINTGNKYILIDVIGNIILNVGSYHFHKNIMLYELYQYPRKKIYFILDNIGIRTKTILTLTTYCLYKNDHYTYLYINILYYLFAGATSYILVCNSKNMDITKNYVICWLSVDVFVGSLFLAYHYNQLVNMYIVLLLLGIVYNCKVFYKVTHIAFHILLVFHNIVLYTF